MTAVKLLLIGFKSLPRNYVIREFQKSFKQYISTDGDERTALSIPYHTLCRQITNFTIGRKLVVLRCRR